MHVEDSDVASPSMLQPPKTRVKKTNRVDCIESDGMYK